MYFGLAYYPEHWPEERWPTDAKMMQDAGVNGVRMGEFGWSAFEPREGEYHFDWLDRAVALLADHGIKTMMCTCSRTPPPWVFTRYPEIRNVRADRMPATYGHRYTVCHNNPTFRELSQHIDRAVIEHYAGDEHVIAWHIDNEIGDGNTCYCDACRAEFHAYLREKYGTVERLNAAWGAHFWSFAFSDFAELPLPVGVPMANPALALEYSRFVSRRNYEFAKWRYDLMKKLSPDKWVTTNAQTERTDHTDMFELGQATDIYGTNYYPPNATELGADYTRGARGEVIILEQRSGQPHWSAATKPGWMRLWAWRSIAHGANGINFFRWRTCRWGQEEYWHGVLPHSGRPNRRYYELKRMGEEVRQLGDAIARTRPPARIALVFGYDSRWALNAVVREPKMELLPEVRAYHQALMEANYCVDAMDPREDLSRYTLVIAPRLYCVDQRMAHNLRDFVEGGGVLCLTPRSGVVDEYNTVFDVPAPGPLREIAGVEVDDYGALDQPVALRGDAVAGSAQARVWADEIILTTAQPVATYAEGWLDGIPAITLNNFGKGKVVYVGTMLRDESLASFTGWLAKLAGVAPVLATPSGVRALERASATERYLFLLNFTDTPQTVALNEQWPDAFGGAPLSKAGIAANDLRILRRAV